VEEKQPAKGKVTEEQPVWGKPMVEEEPAQWGWGKSNEISDKKEEVKVANSAQNSTPSWAAAVKTVEQPKNEPVKVNDRPVTASKKAADKKKPD